MGLNSAFKGLKGNLFQSFRRSLRNTCWDREWSPY